MPAEQSGPRTLNAHSPKYHIHSLLFAVKRLHAIGLHSCRLRLSFTDGTAGGLERPDRAGGWQVASAPEPSLIGASPGIPVFCVRSASSCDG